MHLLAAGNKVQKRKLRTCQNMVWKAFLCFCCLVIYANLHQFAVYMHQNGSDGYLFSLFLRVLELKLKKTLGTCQNLAWKAFLLFGDLC